MPFYLALYGAVADHEQRWDCAKVEWLNVLHHAGKLEAADGSHFNGWRSRMAAALKGAG